MPPRRSISPAAVPPLGQYILNRAIFQAGLERLANPSPALQRRLQEGVRRFLLEVELRDRPGLERLAGIQPNLDWLRRIPFELPNGRRSKPVYSRALLRAAYVEALPRARAAVGRRITPERPVGETERAAWERAFPEVVECERRVCTFLGCASAQDAACVVARHHRDAHSIKSLETLRGLVGTAPSLEVERRARDVQPSDRIALNVIRTQLARAALRSFRIPRLR